MTDVPIVPDNSKKVTVSKLLSDLWLLIRGNPDPNQPSSGNGITSMISVLAICVTVFLVAGKFAPLPGPAPVNPVNPDNPVPPPVVNTLRTLVPEHVADEMGPLWIVAAEALRMDSGRPQFPGEQPVIKTVMDVRQTNLGMLQLSQSMRPQWPSLALLQDPLEQRVQAATGLDGSRSLDEEGLREIAATAYQAIGREFLGQ